MEMTFGNYFVKKEKENFFAIYDISQNPNKLLTHKGTWRQATIIAKLLHESYECGFQEARELYDENAWRY
jgi:hypothetical protein